MTDRSAATFFYLACSALAGCGGDGSPNQVHLMDTGGGGAPSDAGAPTPDAGEWVDGAAPDGGGRRGDAATVDDAAAPSAPPFAELNEQGVLRYLGAGWQPGSTVEGRLGDVAHVFEEADGPRCFTGEPFFVSTRDGASDELMVFVQGGGVCGPDNCGAVEGWPMQVPAFGILDPNDAENPAADFDLGYIPYCDGSLFIGDADHDIDGDGTIDRSFRGLLNLSAALDVIAQRYPSPARILLIGNSAGGFGVHFALPLVRALYPDVAIDMVNDSGVGVLRPGAMDELTAYWNAEAVLPASCEDCVSAAGHLTGYHAYQLRQDPNTRLAYLSSRQDEVVVGSLAGGSGDAFESALIEAAASLDEAFGDRFNSMIIDGSDHTFVLRRFGREVASTSVRAWIAAYLAGDDRWVSVTE